MIIGLGHKKQVGKDTCYKIVKENFPNYNIVRVAFADELKRVVWEALYKNLGFPLEMFDDPKMKPLLRPTLKSHGTFMRDYVDQGFWADRVLNRLTDPDIIYIITDLRYYLSEADKIKNLGGMTIKIIRSEVDDNDTDPSETALDNYTFDYILDNNGNLEDYKQNIIKLFSKILV